MPLRRMLWPLHPKVKSTTIGSSVRKKTFRRCGRRVRRPLSLWERVGERAWYCPILRGDFRSPDKAIHEPARRGTNFVRSVWCGFVDRSGPREKKALNQIKTVLRGRVVNRIIINCRSTRRTLSAGPSPTERESILLNFNPGRRLFRKRKRDFSVARE